jgi:glutamate formiminotransferase
VALIECVPNVSEGRRADVIDALTAAIARPGVHLLDRSSDPSHNRTVYTFAAEPAALREAVLRLFASAIESIDLRTHEGVHPRIGAVDVVPFVPLRETTLDECVALAKDVAETVAGRYGVPIFLYEAAASTDARRNLAEVRRGGLNGLAHRMRRWTGNPTLVPTSRTPLPGRPRSARDRY